MVRMGRLELPWPKPTDFKSGVSTIPPHPHNCIDFLKWCALLESNQPRPTYEIGASTTMLNAQNVFSKLHCFLLGGTYHATKVNTTFFVLLYFFYCLRSSARILWVVWIK